MVQIRGAHALVTGGSSGIGLATAVALATRGARVTIWARGRERLEAAAAVLTGNGAQARADVVDVSDAAAVYAGVERAVAAYGPVDILVTSAGVAHPGHFLQIPPEVFREIIEVNYFGTLYPVQAVAPSMVARGTGSLVAISSGAALLGLFGFSAYSPAKYAVRGLFESLRDELRPHGIHVACVYPPDVDTPMLAAENETKPEETAAISGTVKPIPADQVAGAVVKGIERRQFAIYPNRSMALLGVAGPALSPLLRRMIDDKVDSIQRQG